jgi:phage-related tail fiber protein
MLLPSKELFNGTKSPATTTAEMRIALGALRDYLAGLLGEDSDDKAGARSVLGVINTIIPPGMGGMFFTKFAPTGWLKANGAVVPSDPYVDLSTAIYCGDAANATAAWGYRCTNPANPSGSRSTVGAYIVLPDARAEYMRGWDDGRGIDSSRSLWSWQAGALLLHSHTASAQVDGNHTHQANTGRLAGSGFGIGSQNQPREIDQYTETTAAGTHSHAITVNATGGAENLTRNLAALICIKY